MHGETLKLDVYGVFLNLFIWQRRYWKCWRATTAYRKWWTDNIRHRISRSALEIQIYKYIFFIILWYYYCYWFL